MAGSDPSEDEIKELIQSSADSKKDAYAPYSNFRVGAALLAENGKKEVKIFTGCNVENCAYPLCTCAERCAVVKAVSEGYTHLKAIAVSVDSPEDFASPCGNCRQILAEFSRNCRVIMCKPDGSYYKPLQTVENLLPLSFTKDKLHRGQIVELN